MTPAEQASIAVEFLSVLERKEATLLAWGLTDGAFSDAELERLAEQFLTERNLWGHFTDADDLIHLAEDRKVLFSFAGGDGTRYRTRMAEAVRLFLRLRQLFPKHLKDRRWLTAPTLVADARFMMRPRRYPHRRIAPEVALNQIRAAIPSADAHTIARLIAGRNLADFQVRATARILQELRTDQSASGTVICAGTGSGKTLAFYLPALVQLASNPASDPWPRCLAIYPRNELLKDQFSEIYTQTRLLDYHLAGAGRRKIRIGALMGATPRDAASFSSKWPPVGWKRLADGYVCPLLRCPRPGCREGLTWRDVDRKAGVERLVCSDPSCKSTIQPDEVVLTRNAMLRTPPDILFTTTEMLNQRMADARFGRLFGVGTPAGRKPELVLLDEAHTYGGLSGAQAALLLRRWRHAANANPHFVGLSATLRDARRFFATLIGLPVNSVHEETPAPSELIERGMEYLLALRGDPGSGASLLSTTIQSAMLMRRVLEPTVGASGGLVGKKVFLFTDALDATNRLFFDLRDAEGQNSWGNPDPAKREGSLANLRSQMQPDAANRYAQGQSWNLCEWIGHRLIPGELVGIGRTSSQDAGVDADADVIVATAALEVGFNDPNVGAVLQHKAPRDPAAFLQRKGRAGRDPDMRPWTVVVLSDYGRDRMAYQSYDLLFDPELPARDLPVSNRHVLRMQAVFATMDWMAGQMEGAPNGGVWQDLAQPWDNRSPGEQYNVRLRQQRLAALAEEILTRPERQADLARSLQSALQVSEEDIDAIFWDPPRPLLTAVLPTMVRRLKRQWRTAIVGGGFEFFEPNAPLPEFVPRALFQDLNLPEVIVITAPQQQGDAERRDPLPVARALAEFAPGRVSRRYGLMHRYARHWVAPPTLDGAVDQDLPIESHWPTIEEVGTFQYVEDGATGSVRCVRPWTLRPVAPDRRVLDSSNAFLEWRTQILPEATGVEVELPKTCAWRHILGSVRFHVHAHRCPVEVRRFATGSRATINFEDGRQFDTRIRFVAGAGNTTPVALGFAYSADALALVVQLPCEPHRQLLNPDAVGLLHSLRPQLFRHRVQKSSALDGRANTFARGWLAQTYLCALARIAVRRSLDLESAARELRDRVASNQIGEVLDALFQVLPLDQPHSGEEDEAAGESADDDHATGLRQKTHLRLLGLLADNDVRAELDRAAGVLWDPPDVAWDGWLTDTFLATVCAAARSAIETLCPDLDARELLVDPEAGPQPSSAENITGVRTIWLTESAVSGGGVVEKFQARFSEAPHRFFDLMTRSLEQSDFERTDEQLTRFLKTLSQPDGHSLRDAVAQVREAYERSHDDLRHAFDRLIVELRDRRFIVSHPVLAALNARLLRPGSSPELDRVCHELIVRWRTMENHLGFELDSRAFAWLCCDDKDLDSAFRSPATGASRAWRFGVLSSLFWPRGSAVRGQRLVSYNRFVELAAPERDLVHRLLHDTSPVVAASDAAWRSAAEQSLLEHGVVAIQAPTDAIDTLRAAILDLGERPVDTGLLLAKPKVREIQRDGDELRVIVDLSEGGS